ncbi:MAG TPA: twin-arginine translocase TatA/TatE family subunit, partial [bacterium]|nr:twin-arginine translocase TatA/TatE family subunit [bacterium]
MPGGWEWLVIFAVALIVFGPKRLPEIGKQVGKGMRMFRDASREIQNHLNFDDMDYTPPRKPPR